MMYNNRIFTYYKEALDLSNNIIPTPRMAIIYPVYGCNLNCKGCLYGKENMDLKFMKIEDLKRVLRDLKNSGVKAIELGGGGEPLLHPDINKIIDIITREFEFSLGIITNGTLLSREILTQLIGVAKYIRISIYDDTFYTSIEKLYELIKVKAYLNSKVKIGAKLLVSKSNINDIYKRCKNLLKVNPDLISIKCERNSDNEISAYEEKELREKLMELQSSKLKIELKKSSINCRCWLSPIHTVIDPSGDMYICCYYSHRKEQHYIGNVFRSKFDKLWGSNIHKEKLGQIEPKDCNYYDCRWHFYNQIMGELFKNNDIQHEFC